MAKMDADGSGKIELNEFKTWWGRADRWAEMKLDEKDLEIRKQASEAFVAWETEKKVIEKKDYDQFYDGLIQKKLTTKDKESFLLDLDRNGDGMISFSEYVEWLQRIGTIKVKVIHTDP